MSDDAKIMPVVMCGGAGSRLWPTSRAARPKQFVELLGSRSTFQAAVQRVSNSEVFLKPVIICSEDTRFIVAEQLAQIGVEADIVLEPIRRDSAAAVAIATCYATQRSPETIVLVVAADHVIPDDDAFVFSCRAALNAASKGYIMSLGVAPQYAATAYGYVLPGGGIDGTGAFTVKRFVEKPDADAAQSYVRDGYLWNSGNFLFRADVLEGELRQFEPHILSTAKSALKEARRDLDFIRLAKGSYETAPKASIDRAVMERTTRAGVLPVTFEWSDVGTWHALWSAMERDEFGNAVRGNVEALDTRNSLIHSDDILTAVIGLNDVIVVTMKDAVLVTSRQQSENVKDLVETLRQRGHREATEHVREYRPWGWYQQIDLGPRFKVKRILVHPGGCLSLQKHFHRAEHWVVVRGTAEVTINNQVTVLSENESSYIPIGAMHRLANPGRIPLELIEVQVGGYTGEDDIIRAEDVYGR